MKFLLTNILFVSLLFGNNIQSNISNYLMERLSEYNKVEYKVVSPKNIELDYCIINKSKEFRVEGSYAYIPVEVTTKLNKRKELLLTLKLSLYKNVFVASRAIKKNEVINSNDFKIIEMDVSGLRFPAVKVSKDVEEFRAKFKISENSVLQNSMIEKIPDIMVGDRIEAYFNNNSVNVSFAASARTEGVVGDIIKIKRDDKRIFKARIVNNNIVKIIE